MLQPQPSKAGLGLETASTDNAIVRFNGTTGRTQNSIPTINDDGHITAPGVIIGNGLEQSVANLTALRALSGSALSGIVYVAAHSTAGDGGHGLFRWVAADATADNGGTIIAPAIGGGRFYRMYSGALDVRWFGATGNGVADDTAEIQSALTAATGGGAVHIPAGTYLLSAALTLPTAVTLTGAGPGTTLKASTNSQRVIDATGASNWSISDLAIDGGGQVGGVVTAGVRGVFGIYASNGTNWTIERVKISKCGVKNAAAPATDNGFGGYGIVAEGRAGECAYGVIRDCRVTEIAGGGGFCGDGIYIAGFNANLAIYAHDIAVENCWVSTCGRHCFAAAGGDSESIPRAITFRDCYAEKSGLDGVDIEDGAGVLIEGCTFKACGNDQTYYNPVAEYGATYRLFAAVATGNGDNENVQVIGCEFDGCYYGVSTGSTVGLTVERCRFRNGTKQDLFMGLSQVGGPQRIIDCDFLSTADNEIQATFNTGANFLTFRGCRFTKLFRISECSRLQVIDCTFLAGAQFVSTGISNPSFIGCTFTDFAGSAVTQSAISQNVTDALFQNCRFIGTGGLVNGISALFQGAIGWRIEGCIFSGLTGSGITHSNGNGNRPFASVSNNVFRSCVNGISVTQGIKHFVISGNVFESLTGYCIDVSGVQAGALCEDGSVIGNVAGLTVTNGIRFAVTTGTVDRISLVGNNMHTPSGTKWSVSGNAAGFDTANVKT